MSNPDVPEIVVISARLDATELRRLVGRHFEGMVKYVVDVERRMAAVGGQLHSDAENCLLEQGSRLDNLWGANYFPGRGPEGCIEYTSLINIRPALGNPGMVMVDAALREKVRSVTFELLGAGEPL